MSATPENAVELRDFILSILAEREKAQELRFELMERAVTLAADNVDTRLNHLNALREDYVQDRAQFVQRLAYEEAQKALNDRMRVLENWRGKAAGVGLALALGGGTVGAIAGAVIAHLLK